MSGDVSTNVLDSSNLLASAMNFMQFVDSQKDGISFEELRLELGGIRGCKSPKLARTTLLYWLKKFDFPVQKNGYEPFHLQKLSAFALFLRAQQEGGKRGTLKSFNIFWDDYQNYKRTQNEPQRTTETVTVESQPVCRTDQAT